MVVCCDTLETEERAIFEFFIFEPIFETDDKRIIKMQPSGGNDPQQQQQFAKPDSQHSEIIFMEAGSSSEMFSNVLRDDIA